MRMLLSSEPKQPKHVFLPMEIVRNSVRVLLVVLCFVFPSNPDRLFVSEKKLDWLVLHAVIVSMTVEPVHFLQ